MRTFALAAVAAVVLAGLGCGKARKFEVYVDNSLDHPVQVVLDDDKPRTVKPKSVARIVVPTGKHTFVTTRDGAELERVDFELSSSEHTAQWRVYNVAGAARYAYESRTYSRNYAPVPDPEIEPAHEGEKLIAPPKDVLGRLDSHFPQQSNSASESQMFTRRHLCHYVSADTTGCNRAR